MTFQNGNANERTHQSFLQKRDVEYHSSRDSILLETIQGINFISSFPLDYMHLVCLGVMRTLMYLWLSSKATLKLYKLPAYVTSSISGHLISLRDHMPCEINRKPRSLDEIKRWKATEFRQFLLYTGPVVLKSVLIAEYEPLYNHFLTLSIAIYILLSPKFSTTENLEYAESLLKTFIENTKSLYGNQFITHNVHGLSHLTDFVK